MEEQNKLFIDGFNNGYLIAKYEPELAAKLLVQENGHSEYVKGLASGQKEYETEIRNWAKNFSKGHPAKDDRDLGKER